MFPRTANVGLAIHYPLPQLVQHFQEGIRSTRPNLTKVFHVRLNGRLFNKMFNSCIV